MLVCLAVSTVVSNYWDPLVTAGLSTVRETSLQVAGILRTMLRHHVNAPFSLPFQLMLLAFVNDLESVISRECKMVI